MAVSLTSWALEAELAGAGAGWTALTADVRAQVPVRFTYGISGNGLKDRVASPGSLTFALDNSIGNAAGLLGYYAPDHANLRTGFAVGINLRLSFVYGGTTYYKFHGRLSHIQPVPGQYRSRLTLCTAFDYMDEISRAKLKRVAIQISKRGDEILTTIMDAMVRQPVSRTFGTGRDTYVFALDSSPEEGLGVMEECQRIAQSEVGSIYIKGNTTAGGELVYESRTDRAAKNVNLATFDNTMFELDLARGRDDIINRLQVVTHPKRKDTANQILFNLRDANVSSDTAVSLGAGESKTLVCPYTDPSDRHHRVGGTSMVSPVATTDYLMNSAADGGGSNLTASLGITQTFGATAAFLTLTNNDAATTGFITFLQLRGLGIYDEQDQIWEREDATSQTDFGEQTLTYDMPYQSDPDVGEGASRYFLSLAKDDISSVGGIAILANADNARMTNALAREPGDRIGIAETATGLPTTTGFFIQSANGELTPGGILTMRWGLAPAHIIAFWLLGIAGASELGSTTYVGF